MSSALEVLREAKATISDPSRWTTGYVARDARGEKCAADSPDACKWCALGAIYLAAISRGEPSYMFTCHLSEVALEMGYPSEDENDEDPAGQFNDDPATTHADVMAAFDKAIARAEAEA